MTKDEERVLRAARLYGRTGLGRPTTRGTEKFARAEKRLTSAAVKLVLADRKAERRG